MIYQQDIQWMPTNYILVKVYIERKYILIHSYTITIYSGVFYFGMIRPQPTIYDPQLTHYWPIIVPQLSHKQTTYINLCQ